MNTTSIQISSTQSSMLSRIKTAFMGLLVFTGLLFGQLAFAESAGDIVGVWLTEDKDGYIEVFEQDGKYHGKSIGSPENKQRLDTENPDESLRSRSLLGVVLLQNLEFDGDDTWEGGSIYDPKSGKTYKAKAELKGSDTLKLRGYIGSPMLGKTTKWTLLTKDAASFDAKAGITK